MSQREILQLLDSCPGRKYTVQQLCDKLGLGTSTVQRNIQILKRHNLISHELHYTTVYPSNGKRRILRVWR